VSEFRRLFLLAVSSGSLAGLLWFGVQYFAVIPLIEEAEQHEATGHEHHEEGWRPEDGWQRNSFTAVSSVLAGIGFAAVLFSAVSLTGQCLDVRRGALWGLAGFASVSLSPALGLPPRPPGVAAADLFDRQLWWAATVAATAIGLFLIARTRAWLPKLAGLACLVLPHAVGAPATTGEMLLASLATQFAVASVTTSAVFWLALGIIGGFLNARYARPSAEPASTL
jgi:cobalt transporter subunit CbtA